MYKRIENNSENNRQYLAISRRGAIHTCIVDTVYVRGEKMAYTTVVAQRNHTFTFDESIWSSSRSIIRRLYIYIYIYIYIYLHYNITNDDSSFCEINRGFLRIIEVYLKE